MMASSQDLDAACQRLAAGELVAFPTETVYGLGADARNPMAVRRIFALKGRPARHPVIVHLANSHALPMWARDIPPLAWELLQRFSPGPLTLVLSKHASVIPEVTGGQDTIGIRIPQHPQAQALLQRLESIQGIGAGIAAPSANRFGSISPTRADHVRAAFGEALMVLDGGASHIGLESTILDVSRLSEGGAVRLLRPGDIDVSTLRTMVPELDIASPSHSVNVPRVSGSLERHYAPRTPCYRTHDVTAQPLRKDDAILSHQPCPIELEVAQWHQLPNDPKGYGQALYDALHQLDGGGYGRILITMVPTSEAWHAVRDRLRRASQPLPPHSA